MKFESILKNRVTFYVITIVVLVPVFFLGTTNDIIRIWSVNATFTHGFLIFPISIWLIWTRRSSLSRCRLEPAPLLMIPVILILLGWLAASLIDVKVVQQIAMVSLIPTLAWMLLGRPAFLAVLFPIAFLYFSVPIGQALIPPMMEFTADFTVQLVRLSGVPIFQDGLAFKLPSGSWSVVEECSGVRYLIASVALGTVFAYLNFNSLKKRLIFVAVATIVPVIANGLRAYGIVMIGHLSGMKLATGVDHLLYGWFFFGIVIFLLFFIGGIWRDPSPENPTSSNTATAKEEPTMPARGLVLAISFVVVGSVAQLIASSARSDLAVDIPEFSDTMASEMGSWSQTQSEGLRWSPQWLTADFQLEREYESGTERVQINIAYYAFQRDGAEAVSSQNRLTNPYGGQWRLTNNTSETTGYGTVTESQVSFGDRRILVWSWYTLGDRRIANPYIAKAFEAFNTVILRQPDASITSVATELDNVESSRETLAAFLSDAEDEIDSLLLQLSSEATP